MNRREFLRLAGATTGVLAAESIAGYQFVTGLNYLVSRLAALKRTERPLFRNRVQPGTVLPGIAPQDNNIYLLDQQGKRMIWQPLVNFFVSWDSPTWFSNDMAKAYARNQIPVISLRPNDTSPWRPFKMEEIKNMGEKIKQKTKDLADLPVVFFRDFYEGNLPLMPHGPVFNTARMYRMGCRYFVDDVRSVVPQAKFIWATYSTILGNPIDPYYPGDDYVDVVAVDGYPAWSADIFNLYHYFGINLTPEELFGPDIATLQQIAPKKPIMIAETGGGQEPWATDWLINLLNTAPKYKNLTALCLFSWEKPGEPASNLLSDPETYQRLNNALQQNSAYLKERTQPAEMEKKLLTVD